MLHGHVGQQEVLSESAVSTETALEGLVTDMGELVVQQRLLVLADKLTEFALEPGGGQRQLGGGVQEVELGAGSTLQAYVKPYLRLATAWICVSRCILKV